MPSEFIDSATLAALAGVSERAARKAIASGKIQGHEIEVVTVDGTRSHGGRMRLVQSSSLPAPLQHRLRDLNTDAIDLDALRIDERGLAEHNWKLSIIRPILAHPWGTSERRAAIRQLVGNVVVGWDGKPWTLKETTLELWIRTYEENDGLHLCLAKKIRKDKGKPRVMFRKDGTMRSRSMPRPALQSATRSSSICAV